MPKVSKMMNDKFLLECEYLIGDLAPVIETYDKQYFILDELTNDIFKKYNEFEIASYKGGYQFEKNLERAYRLERMDNIIYLKGDKHV